MNAREAAAAFEELLANARGKMQLALEGMTLHMRCVDCKATDQVELEVSDAGDERTVKALRAFQDAHRHD